MTDREDLLNAARDALGQGDTARASDLLERALKLEPNDPRTWTLMGRVRNERQIYDGAVLAFERAIELAPDLASARSGIADVLIELGKVEAAVHHLSALLNYAPTVPHLVLLANAQLMLGRDSDALSTLREAVEQEPENVEGLLGLARVVRKTNRGAALELLNRATRVDPLFSVAHAELGSVFAAAGKLEEAEHAFRTAIALDPHQAWHRLELANVLWERGDLGEAEAEYLMAAELAPYWPRPRFCLGEFLEATDRDADAEVAYRAAIQIEPLDAEAAFKLGGFLVRSGRSQEGLDWARRALQTEPAHLGALRLIRDNLKA